MGRIAAAAALILGILLSLAPAAAPVLERFLNPYTGVPGGISAAGVPTGVIEAPGIHGRAVVVWDLYGVPHIYATTDEAGFYAVGWVTASQRLFQMDLLRRVPEARLSALIGEKGLESDKFMLQSGIADSINKTIDAMRSMPEMRPVLQMLEAYSRGVNDYIRYAEENNLLPIEYRVLGQKPEPWTPRDTVAVAKLIAYVLAWNDEDLVVQRIAERWGVGTVLDLGFAGPNAWNGTVPQADCRYAKPWSSVTGINQTPTIPRPPSTSLSPQALGDIINRTLEPLRILGAAEEGLGSNNWVVNGSYTASGRPLLANDPHLSLTAPPIWFLVELETPSYHVIGALFPGTPLVIIGRNRHVAWAFTNVMGDFTDYYYYKWSDNGSYLYRGKWLRPEAEERAIKVWDPVKRAYRIEKVTVARTVHGYLIEAENGERLAVRWTGQDPSFEVAFFYLLDRASSVREALQAQKYFHVPVQNFVVADDKGNFAYSPFGAFPNRTNLPVVASVVVPITGPGGNSSVGLAVPVPNTGFMPFNGSRGEGEWNGYVPPCRIPTLYDPPLPYIVTANSKPWNGSCGSFYGWHFHDKYRELRIQILLDLAIARTGGHARASDMMAAQYDILDLGLLDYLKTLVDIVGPGTGNASLDSYLRIAREWLYQGGVPRTQSTGAAVAAAWVFTFHKNLWKKLYGSTEHLWFFREYYAQSLIRAIERGDPNATRVLGEEELRGLAIRSLAEAVANLTRYFGTSDPSKWSYGRLHYYSVRHPAFHSMDLPRWPAPGGTWSVSAAPIKEFTAENGMPVTVGPSLRMVADLAGDAFYINLPGGESGSPFSPHYWDLYLLWLNSVYVEYHLGQDLRSYPWLPRLVIEGAPSA